MVFVTSMRLCCGLGVGGSAQRAGEEYERENTHVKRYLSVNDAAAELFGWVKREI